MKKIFITIAAAAAALLSIEASAQNNLTGFFLDNYAYGYKLNPAQANDYAFFGLAVNNINASVSSNVGAGAFFFPNGGKLVTGLNSAISKDQFMKGLKPVNSFGTDISETLFAVGFKGKNSYHTIELNIRTNEDARLPKELFEFLKAGPGTGTFNIPQVSASAYSFAELAYGYSTKIGDKLSIGGRAKLLLGIEGANISLNNLSVQANEQAWKISSTGTLAVSGAVDMTTTTSASSGKTIYDYNSMRFDSGNIIAGFGFGLDLGATYEVMDGLTVSAALLDFGGISWKNNIYGTASGSWDYTGMGDNINESSGSAKNPMDGLVSMIEFSKASGSSSFKMNPFTLNGGVRYILPFYDKANVGLIANHRFNGTASWTEVRLGAGITPVKLVSLAVSAGMGTFGFGFGANLDLHLGPVNIFIGADSLTPKLTKEFIPVNASRFTLNAGLTFCF